MVSKVSPGQVSKILVFGVTVVAVLMIAGSVTYASFVAPYGNIQNGASNYENVIGNVNGRISATLAGIQSHESHIAPYYPSTDSIRINPHIGNNPTVPFEYTPSQTPITTPTITYFTATNATGKFIRSVSPINIAVKGLSLSETQNTNGSITLNDSINGSVKYSDAGFVYYNVGPLSSINNISVHGNATINLWFDVNGNGEYFSWNNNTLSNLGGDNYAMSGLPIKSVNNTTVFGFMNSSDGSSSFSLKQLKDGKYAGIGNNTEVAIWVGVAVDNPGQTAGWPSSESTTVSVSISRSVLPVIDTTHGWEFSSIQSSINASNSGDTIQVAPGNYSQQLTINKSITLLGDPSASVGPGSNAPVIDGTNIIDGKGISINNTSNVTVSGFVIENFTFHGSNLGVEPDGIALSDAHNVTITHNLITNNNYGISIDEQLGSSYYSKRPRGSSSNVNISNNIINGSFWPSSSSWAEGGIAVTSWYSTGNNLTISGNLIENSDRNGILTGAGINVKIMNNTILNSGWSAIETDDTINATIASNTISGGFLGVTTNASLSSQGILVYGTNGLSNPPSSGFSITGLTISGNNITAASTTPGFPPLTEGIWLIGWNYPINGAAITNNSISGEKSGILVWGPQNVSVSISGNKLINNGVQFNDTTNTMNIQQILTKNTFDRAVVVQQAQIADPMVLTNIGDHIIWSNIADAVANSSSGDTVKVLPGIYPSASPIIITTSSLWIQSITGIYNDSGVYLNAASPEINLNGRPPSYFQLGGSSDPASNAGSPVENVLIGGFNFEGAGIEVPGTGGGNISIILNSFTNTSGEAIGYHGNSGLAAPLGSIGILSNTFKNIGTDSPGSTASAIWLGNVVNSFVTFNEINNTAYAGIILTGTRQGNESDINIDNNTISNIPHQGIQIANGNNDWVIGNIVTLSGMDWNVTDSGPILGRDAAISLFNPSQDNIFMLNNVLSDSYDGLAVGQVSAFSLFNDSLGSNIIFQNNSVFNLIHYGVANYAVNGSMTLNAEYNWWGGPHGPNTTGSAKVYGRVNYVPALSLPFNVPTASVTIVEYGLAPGTQWSATLNGTTYSTYSNSITVPNNIVLDNNTYLTEFAQGSYNISVSVGQPYYFAYWSSSTSSISFESRSAGSTVVAINGSGTITATFGLPLDGSFTLATTPVKTVVGTIVSLNTTWRNNLPFQQVTGIVWFEVENASTGQTVMIAATSLTLTPGSSSSAYLGLSTLAPGTYNVEVFATTSQGVPISPTTTVTVTV